MRKTISFRIGKNKEKEKTDEILEILTAAQDRVKVSEIASRIGLSDNKTSRILKTLCTGGQVERLKDHYRLVFSHANLAQKQLSNMSVINAAHPVLVKLADTLDEAIYLTIPKDDEVFFLDMADSHRQVKTASLLGRLLPFFTNAAGKVMRCLDSRELVERLLKKIGRNKGNLELKKLELELEDIRNKGVAVDKGGLGEGIISVAVAVRDYSGAVVGAIILIGPSFRIMTERLEKEIIPTLKEGADLLSGSFGYCPA
ncbi:MAG TPA: IclR family transcriptional regulator [Geobacter sp.]|nr:IclR family transcriptional regulator [Geobacter sp.]